MPKPTLDKVIFYVTNRCNYKCAHCFYWENLNVKDILSTEEMKKIIESFGKLDTVLIAGGEPFLRRDIIELAKHFVEKCKVRLISVPTNGSMHAQAINFIKEISPLCEVRMYVSIDGLRETHNEIRGLDCYDKSIDLMKKMVEMKKEYDFTPMAMITVSNKNIKDVDPLADILNKVGIYYSITPIRGMPKDSDLRAPTALEWKELVDNLQKNRKFLGEESSFHNNKTNVFKRIHRRLALASRTKMYMNGLNGKRGYVCTAGNSTAVLDYDGTVRLCELTGVVGNVKDYDYNFQKVWLGAGAEDMRPKIKTCVCTHACFITTRYMQGAQWLSQLLS